MTRANIIPREHPTSRIEVALEDQRICRRCAIEHFAFGMRPDMRDTICPAPVNPAEPRCTLRIAGRQHELL